MIEALDAEKDTAASSIEEEKKEEEDEEYEDETPQKTVVKTTTFKSPITVSQPAMAIVNRSKSKAVSKVASTAKARPVFR